MADWITVYARTDPNQHGWSGLMETPKSGYNKGGGMSKKYAISLKWCKLRLGYYDGLIGCRMHAFNWYQNQ